MKKIIDLKFLVCILLSVVIGNLSLPVFDACAADVTPLTSSFIVKALEYQESLVKNIEMEYNTYVFWGSQELDTTNYSGTMFKQKYISKDIKEYVEVTFFEKDSGVKETKASFDGERGLVLQKYISLQGKEGLDGVIKAKRPSALRTYGKRVLYCNVWDKMLIERLQEGRITLVSQKEMIDGKDCYVIKGDCVEDPGLGYKLWVDETIGFLPRKMEYTLEGKRVGGYYIFRGFESISDGGWFPKRIEYKEDLNLDTAPAEVITHLKKEGLPTSGHAISQNITIISSVTINQTIPDNLFLIQFPSGTRISDEIIGTSYVIP